LSWASIKLPSSEAKEHSVWNKMGLSAKLNSGFTVLLATALLLAGVSVAAMHSLKTALDSVIQGDVRKVELAGRIQYSSADLLRVENHCCPR